MAIFSKIMKRWGEDYAAHHDGLDPLSVTWNQSHAWDQAHTNESKLFAREPDMERFRQAFELAEASEFESALDIWRDLAANGSAGSMVEIGACYETGCVVAQDTIEAEQWYYRAFLGGSQSAMLRYAAAAAARRDFKLCEEILEVGVRQDWTPAIFWQAWYRHRQSENSVTYQTILPALQKAARRGHPAARMILSTFMVQGKFGILRIPLGFLLAARTSWEEALAD